VAVAVIGVLILIGTILALAVSLRSERGAYAVGQRLGAVISFLARLTGRPSRGDWGAIVADFRHRTIKLLRVRWAYLTGATLLSHLTLYVVLLLTLRHVGVSNESVG
jgi:hypothetical protein